MCLRLALGNLDQIFVAQTRGLRQYRSGNRDVFINGELPHHAGWRIFDRTKALAELFERFSLDPLDEMLQNAVEYTDLAVAKALRVDKEKIGNAPQCLDAFVRRAAC